MLDRLTPLSPVRPIVGRGGVMTQEATIFMQALSRAYTIIGVGSPEGSVEASPPALYLDSSGTSGSILYVKRDYDVSGDRTKGWILV